MADIHINIKSKNAEMKKSMKGVTSSLKGLSSATNKSTGSFSKFYKQQKKTNKQLQNMTKDANRASNSMLKLKGSVGGLNQVLGSAKIIAFGYFMAKNVNAAMEMIETINLFGVSMGKTTEEANKFVVAISDAFGLDPTNVMNAVGTYNLLATSMGVSAKNAYTLSTNTAKLGYDLSSLFNIPIDQVMGDLRSGLVGQSETMYKYGVDVTEASLKQEALNQGIEKSVRNMSQGEKMGLRYSVMLRQTGVAQGDFSRTLEQPANQMKIFTEQVSRLSRTIGTVFIPIMAKVLPYLNAFVSLLIDAISALATFFGYKAPDFPDIAAGLSGVSAGTDDINAATSAIKALKNVSSGMDELNIIAETPSAGGAGGGASIGGGDFDLSGYDNMLDKVKAISDELKINLLDSLKKVFFWVTAIGIAFGSWKISGLLMALSGVGKLGVFKRILSDIVGFFLLIKSEGIVKTLAGLLPVKLLSRLKIFGTIFGIITGLLSFVFGMKDLITETETSWASVGKTMGGVAGIALGLFLIPGMQIPALITLIVGALATLVTVVIKNWDAIKKWTKELWDKVALWTYNAWEDIKIWISESLDNIVAFFKDLPKRLGYELGRVFATITNWGIDVKTWIAEAIPKLIGAIITFFAELPEKIRVTMGNIQRTIGNWVISAIGWVKAEFPKLLNNIISFFTELPGKLFNIGKNIVKNLWNGIISVGNWLKNKVKSFFGGLWSGVSSFFSGFASGYSTTMDVIPKFADGGFPTQGTMFMANEAGAEMVGSINNKPAVVNNDQIVAAVSAGVAKAVASVMVGQSEKPIIVNLDGEVIYTNQQEISRNRGINLGLGVFAR